MVKTFNIQRAFLGLAYDIEKKEELGITEKDMLSYTKQRIHRIIHDYKQFKTLNSKEHRKGQIIQEDGK